MGKLLDGKFWILAKSVLKSRSLDLKCTANVANTANISDTAMKRLVPSLILTLHYCISVHSHQRNLKRRQSGAMKRLMWFTWMTTRLRRTLRNTALYWSCFMHLVSIIDVLQLQTKSCLNFVLIPTTTVTSQRAKGHMLQNASFTRQSQNSFLNTWENTHASSSGIRADVTVFLKDGPSIGHVLCTL